MDRRDPDVVAIVTGMKDRARESPWMPLGLAPRERYHRFPDGLSLCLTLDILTREYVSHFLRIFGAKHSEELSEGGKFWHLSIARLVGHGPTPEEVEFWRRAFFEEEPIIEMPGLLPTLISRHFFWRAE